MNKQDNWYQNAPTKIAEATADINTRFSTIGIEFISSISYYPCNFDDAGTTRNYSIIEQSGVYGAASAVFRERGT